ncbi:LCP family protein [Propionibacterium australiense]|uniref:LytR family transcriptional regulator n=1 Tax=Propionibacterium australiense TaxID=119981 RepID=A0A383S611_9ACTN|nr:LCP family protein [Propionibacterium australiense]RLP10607.1 LytR family transcriptional regulator [Propionibacterium australiense]RLP12903.1 LytR family transcriptional regulator [Propionibacterium australiense]SYZ32809.1 lytR_cpsA_psr: cell envelope-related function transcriptional attenuator common domain [Propionibacterium australiense]VEH91201.1 Regulatory protein msrR [Propionibacterium australiense]
MADSRDESSRREDLDWLYHRAPGDEATRTPPAAPATNIANDADISRREQAFLEQHRRQQAAQGRSAPTSRYPRQQGRPAASGWTRPTREDIRREPVPAPAPAPGRRGRPARPRRRGRRLRRTVLTLVLAWLVFTIATPGYAWAQMATVDWEPAYADRIANQPGSAILLVGSDSREGLSDEEKAELGTGDAEGQRTDSIMLLYTPLFGDAVLISIPRDSYVSIPGYGMGKINAAYSYGGPQLLTQTVEQATGMRIDGFMEVGFAGFAAMVDAVGGVDVCLDEPMADEKANIDLPAGCQTLGGSDALGYVRHRYGDSEGDLGRARRQREVIAQIATKLKTPSTVLNPVKWWRINMAMSGAVSRGEDMGPLTMGAMARGVLSVAGGGGTSLQVPLETAEGWSADGQSVVIWDSERASAMFGELSEGDTSNIAQYAD